MKIALITPAGRESKSGNRNTAVRWARFLRELGHRVSIQTEWDGSAADLMLALHARRSHISIKRYATLFPEHPLIVTLTGTDLYRDIQFDVNAQESLRLATRLIVLQDQGRAELTPSLRAKTHVVVQSAQGIKRNSALKESFEVLVIGHLREEKDPLRTALALRYLPRESRIQVRHFGKSLDDTLAAQAVKIMGTEPRYRWLGERPHWQVRQYLARAKLMVISSSMEGGANVVSEALAARCPVLASKVSGNIGMLGRDYGGYFPLADEQALARMLVKAEIEGAFYRGLILQCASRAKLMTPQAERKSLAQVIAAVT